MVTNRLLELEALLGNGDEFVIFKLLQLLHSVLIDGVSQVETLDAALLQSLEEGR